MLKILDYFEKTITLALVILMIIVVAFTTIELGRLILVDLFSPPIDLLNVSEMLDIFGIFLLVLVGIELLDTIKAYLIEHVVHEEVIVAAALVAVLRKVIILDVKTTDSLTIIGIAVIILAVSMAYWIVKRMHAPIRSVEKE
jgi:uncharacterized membrane protein (DUF373 family)